MGIVPRCGSPELQNFLAFAEGFERLLAIIVEETQQGEGEPGAALYDHVPYATHRPLPLNHMLVT